MDKITQLKTWLEDTIKHGGNNQHTLSGVLHKIDEIYEWDKCVLTKAREIEAEESILKVEDPLDKVRAGLKHRIKSYIEQKSISSNNRQIDFYNTSIQECQSVLDSELSQDTKKAQEIEETKPIELPREYPADILSSESDIKIHTLTKSLREVIKVVNKLNNK